MFNELKSLNIYESFGPDQVNPKLLLALADNNSCVRCIMHLFLKCINEQRIPNIWIKANVVALDPLNYRPVSLTCILCKIYEKFLRRGPDEIFLSLLMRKWLMTAWIYGG